MKSGSHFILAIEALEGALGNPVKGFDSVEEALRAFNQNPEGFNDEEYSGQLVIVEIKKTYLTQKRSDWS